MLLLHLFDNKTSPNVYSRSIRSRSTCSGCDDCVCNGHPQPSYSQLADCHRHPGRILLEHFSLWPARPQKRQPRRWNRSPRLFPSILRQRHGCRRCKTHGRNRSSRRSGKLAKNLHLHCSHRRCYRSCFNSVPRFSQSNPPQCGPYPNEPLPWTAPLPGQSAVGCHQRGRSQLAARGRHRSGNISFCFRELNLKLSAPIPIDGV